MRVLALLALLPAAAGGMDLKPETVKAWNEYVKNVDGRMKLRAESREPFLWIDEHESRGRRVRSGEIVVAPATVTTPHRVPYGLIHDWIGAVFIRDATVDDVTAVLREYDRYPEFYSPHVIDAKTIRHEALRDDFSVVLANRALLVSTALDSDYESHYFALDANRAYGISATTRVQQIEDQGQDSQHLLPIDRGSGYIWRLHSVMRLEHRDGGVYFEVEAIALSRDIPSSVRWFVDPIVRNLSRSALNTSLQQTRDAVRARFTVTSTPQR
jgi:hypothetical protein